MHKTEITRRQFLAGTAAAAGTVLLSSCTLQPSTKMAKRTAADPVTLGKTGLRLSRLGIGTGSNGGSIQRRLEREEFNRLVRYAYDQGITYIDTAQSYNTHEWVRDAIKPLPREKLFIQTKMHKNTEKPLEVLDRFRKELNTDYLDSVLVHCAVTKNWDEEQKIMLEAFEEAKDKQIIRAHGVSCHSLPALSRAAQLDWVDVHLVRINPQGAHMDTPVERWNAKSDASHVPAVMEQIRAMHRKHHGIIGMKIIGNGDFTDPADREKSIRFAMQCGLLDAIVIGFKSTAEVDEAIRRMNSALAAT
jgi:predicted aldo/keto reductase-like oxidoreductase